MKGGLDQQVPDLIAEQVQLLLDSDEPVQRKRNRLGIRFSARRTRCSTLVCLRLRISCGIAVASLLCVGVVVAVHVCCHIVCHVFDHSVQLERTKLDVNEPSRAVPPVPVEEIVLGPLQKGNSAALCIRLVLRLIPVLFATLVLARIGTDVHHSPACGTVELPFEPPLKARLVEDVTTGQLLGRVSDLITADDTDAVAGGQFLLGGILKELVHRRHDPSIALEVRPSLVKLVERHPYVANNVQRERVFRLDVDKGEHQHKQLQHVRQKLVVESESSLCLPVSVQVQVRGKKYVANDIREQVDGQHGKLKGEKNQHRLSVLHRVRGTSHEQMHVQEEQNYHEGHQSSMLKQRRVGLLFHKLHPIFGKPVENLEEQ
mmetsp:Transcript_5420/g.16167  ORF Transcript_5420/g.16167 Transcript_5420/m.16167 type:complete len:374 (-) Transcript_5420:523-1644(-)